jgi:hypothetical protein
VTVLVARPVGMHIGMSDDSPEKVPGLFFWVRHPCPSDIRLDKPGRFSAVAVSQLLAVPIGIF